MEARRWLHWYPLPQVWIAGRSSRLLECRSVGDFASEFDAAAGVPPRSRDALHGRTPPRVGAASPAKDDPREPILRRSVASPSRPARRAGPRVRLGRSPLLPPSRKLLARAVGLPAPRPCRPG